MKISHVSSSADRPGVNSSGIAALQGRIKELSGDLKAVALSDATPQEKDKQTKLLQAMIQMLQQQIASIQQRSQTEQIVTPQVRAAAHSKEAAAGPSGGGPSDQPDGLVDIYV